MQLICSANKQVTGYWLGVTETSEQLQPVTYNLSPTNDQREIV